MLFSKSIEPKCAYCQRGKPSEGDTILCIKKGVRPIDGKCMCFRYDPCKRIPSKPKALDFKKYDQDDFSL